MPFTPGGAYNGSVKRSEGLFDIVIVGGGMVGAAMACLLADLPVRVALADRAADAPRPPTGDRRSPRFDLRVSALTPASIALLDGIGAWPAIEAMRCCPFRDMEVWDADGSGAIRFSADALGAARLGAVVENSVVGAALRRRLAAAANVQVLAPCEIVGLRVGTGEPATLTTGGGATLSASLVIAADGPGSSIRRLAGFVTREWDYGHRAIVTTARAERPHGHAARQRFIDTGPLAFLPLSPAPGSADQRHCSIVWSAVPGRAEALMAMDDAAFARELGRAIEGRLGAVEWTDRRVMVPLRQRRAPDYFRDNVVLIGDAAHTIHPLAGQGVNLGFGDAEALAGELARACRAGRRLADPVVLGRYQRRRKARNVGMMWAMEGFRRLFADQPPPVRWLRNAGMSGLDRLAPVKNLIARRAMESG